MNLLWPMLYLFTNILMILCFNSANFNLSFLKKKMLLSCPAPCPVGTGGRHGSPVGRRARVHFSATEQTCLFSSCTVHFLLELFMCMCVYSSAGKKEGGGVVCLTWTVSC